MLASECTCCMCGKQAYAFWPMIDTDIPSHPYCKKCLRETQLKVITSVIGEKQGKKLYRKHQRQKGTNK